MKFDKGS